MFYINIWSIIFIKILVEIYHEIFNIELFKIDRMHHKFDILILSPIKKGRQKPQRAFSFYF